jgi:hypothetical protein
MAVIMEATLGELSAVVEQSAVIEEMVSAVKAGGQ